MNNDMFYISDFVPVCRLYLAVNVKRMRSLRKSPPKHLLAIQTARWLICWAFRHVGDLVEAGYLTVVGKCSAAMKLTNANKKQRNPKLFAEKVVGLWHDLAFRFTLFTIQRATSTWQFAGASLFPVTVAKKVAKKLEVPDSWTSNKVQNGSTRSKKTLMNTVIIKYSIGLQCI